MALWMAGLAEIGPDADARFGGKAAGLARLRAAGSRVPGGFAVGATIEPPASWTAAERQELRGRAEDLLHAGPVAVRSSALGEDSPTRSFAGMFETVLGLRSAEEVEAAAGRCIASGASPRVLAYAGASDPVPVGLVVQSMVEARCAGVCFTVDPAGTDAALLVEAVAGTGEALVSGRAHPERWRLYRSGLGGWEARREGSQGILTTDEARLLAEQACALAQQFGRPLDLEWAFDGTGLWWLQARPVTAAAPPPPLHVERFAEGVDDGPVTVWANFNIRETMPDPFTPLNWSLWRQVVLPVVMEDILGVRPGSEGMRTLASVDLVHGRLYWNMNAMGAGPWRLFTAHGLRAIDVRAAEVIEGLQRAGVLRPRRLHGRGWRSWLAMAGASARALGRLAASVGPRRALQTLEEGGRRIAARPPVSVLSDPDLVREMGLLGAPEALPFRRAMQMVTMAMLVYIVAERVFRAHPEAQRRLAAGIAGNPTTQISLGIDTLVEQARSLADAFRETSDVAGLQTRLAREPGGTEWLRHLDGFLERFGQRSPQEFDIAAPRWSDDPSMIVDLVRTGLQASPSAETATRRLARMARERRDAVDAAASASPAWRRPLLRGLARLVELHMPLREAPKHHTMFIFLRMRMAALELGRRLAARGILERADEVMFVELSELRALADGGPAPPDLPALLKARRDRFAKDRGRKAPHFVRSDGVPVDEDDPGPAADGVLRGIGAAGGSASGPVRILRDPDPRALGEGEVLVVELADPGWTPLFPRACALVMEVGGLMCHAAVVARELGIPAVFGVAGATARLADGQAVRVDGDRGTVTPVLGGGA